jgi:predicted AlkP superfamily phosphohydrolase/phosphomutase
MLLIIGLDGATWDLADPWIARGELPHLAALRRRALWGPLASTMPPATLPSWTTFMTGVNPGKHGIFDFTRRQFGSYDVRFVNASFRRAPTVWRLLSDAGRRVCVLGVPGTYPPETLNGCMVSGFDTPVTTRADASFVSPASLAPLVAELGGFPFADFQEFRVGPAWYRMALERLQRGIESKTRLAQALLARERWDCFMLLFGESDTVAHHFWKFHDPDSPRFDAQLAPALGDALLHVYRRLDAAIGTLVAAAPGAAVLLASDHGFGGAGDKAVHLNLWLRAHGLQHASAPQRQLRIATYGKQLALRAIPAGWQAKAFRLRGGRWASRLESRARFAGIDWERTRAFSEELNYFPSVWLNLKGREPQGTVAPGDYERVRDDVCAAAAALHDPDHGGGVVRRAWRREELYHGTCVEYAPDVILELALDRGYSYNCLPSLNAPTSTPVRHLTVAEVRDGKLGSMSGSHRPNGMFLLANGTPLGRRIEGVQMADMAATVLTVCNVSPPAEFDGVTIQGVVGTKKPLVFPAADPSCERCYGDAEEGEIASRLSAMGYLG